MNNIINNFLLAADKFMPEMHLRQPRFTYSACGPLTKNEERIKKFKKTGDSRYIYQNELDRACFQHDMAYGDFEGLNRRTAADKVLPDKAFILLKIQNMMVINVNLFQWSKIFLIKKLLVVVLKIRIF